MLKFLHIRRKTQVRLCEEPSISFYTFGSVGSRQAIRLIAETRFRKAALHMLYGKERELADSIHDEILKEFK